MSLHDISDGVRMTDAARDIMRRADCMVFDCDGVLVDVSGSYYATISETVLRVLDDVSCRPNGGGGGTAPIVTPDIIDGFKAAGRFNDEVDLSCAIIAGAAAAHNSGTPYADVISDIMRNAAPGGIERVLQYAQGMSDISRVTGYMEHPSPGRDGRLCRMFDQIFFGPEMYRQVRGKQPYLQGPGMINRDRTIITDGVLRALSSRFGGRMAMVTGRGLRPVQHTLRPLLKWFDMENSAFLEDEPRENAKPNPVRLDQCIAGMGGRRTIYVGDSVEDVIMSNDASADVLFCGIAERAGRREEALLRAGAQAVLDSVLHIPKALNLEA